MIHTIWHDMDSRLDNKIRVAIQSVDNLNVMTQYPSISFIAKGIMEAYEVATCKKDSDAFKELDKKQQKDVTKLATKIYELRSMPIKLEYINLIITVTNDCIIVRDSYTNNDYWLITLDKNTTIHYLKVLIAEHLYF